MLQQQEKNFYFGNTQVTLFLSVSQVYFYG